jgi:hypothetical protein
MRFWLMRACPLDYVPQYLCVYSRNLILENSFLKLKIKWVYLHMLKNVMANSFMKINSGEALGSTTLKRFIQPTGLDIETLKRVVKMLWTFSSESFALFYKWNLLILSFYVKSWKPWEAPQLTGLKTHQCAECRDLQSPKYLQTSICIQM